MAVSDWPKAFLVGWNLTEKLEKITRGANRKEQNERIFCVFCCVLKRSKSGYLWGVMSTIHLFFLS